MTNRSFIAHLAIPLMGVSTGLRSFTALAATAWFARNRELRLRGTWAAPLARPEVVAGLTALALGEYIGDKLPNTPNRTAPLGLTGRLAIGAAVGAVIATALKRPVAAGIGMGFAGALAGTYGGFALRRALTQGTGWPDLPVALSGDLAAMALAVRSLERLTA